MGDEIRYEVHLENGEVWYCRDFRESLVEDDPLWFVSDESNWGALLGAIEKSKVNCTDVQPTTFYLFGKPCGIAIVTRTIIPAWYRDDEKHLRKMEAK